jgi:hypothetical protein
LERRHLAGAWKHQRAPATFGAPASCRRVETSACASNIWSAGILPARGNISMRQQHLERRHLAGAWKHQRAPATFGAPASCRQSKLRDHSAWKRFSQWRAGSKRTLETGGGPTSGLMDMCKAEIAKMIEGRCALASKPRTYACNLLSHMRQKVVRPLLCEWVAGEPASGSGLD